MFSIVKKAILMATRKGYIDPSISPAGAYIAEESRLLSARQALTLNPEGNSVLTRQGRTEPVFLKEVLPQTLQNKKILTPDHSSETTTREGEGEPPAREQSSQLGEPGRASHQGQPVTVNYMNMPMPVPDPSSYQMHGGNQWQFVQMAPSTQHSQPSSVHSTPALGPQNSQLCSAATTPGSIHLPPAAVQTPGGFGFPVEGSMMHKPRRGIPAWQMNNSMPKREARRHLSQVEGHPRVPQYGYIMTPMGLPPHAQLAQHEGQQHYVLSTMPNGYARTVQLLQV